MQVLYRYFQGFLGFFIKKGKKTPIYQGFPVLKSRVPLRKCAFAVQSAGTTRRLNWDARSIRGAFSNAAESARMKETQVLAL